MHNIKCRAEMVTAAFYAQTNVNVYMYRLKQPLATPSIDNNAGSVADFDDDADADDDNNDGVMSPSR